MPRSTNLDRITARLDEVRDYMLCPKRLQLRRRSADKPRTWEERKIHSLRTVLTRMFRRGMVGKDVSFDHAARIWVTLCGKQVSPDDPMLTEGLRTLLAIFSKTFDLGYTPLIAKMPFQLQLGLKGEIDFVFQTPDRTLIFIWIRERYEPSLLRHECLSSVVFHLVGLQNMVHRDQSWKVIEFSHNGGYMEVPPLKEERASKARDRLRQITVLAGGGHVQYPDFDHCGICPFKTFCGS